MMDAIKTFLFCVDVFFVLYLVGYSTFLFLSVIYGSVELFQRREDEELENTLHHDIFIPISIIVPIYNEAVTVKDTIITLLDQKYKLYEIIVVDDGSTDDSAKIVIDSFGLSKVERPIQRRVPCKNAESVYEGTTDKGIKITLVSKENGGKADALNMGINASEYPYFICMDGDSMLQNDSLFEIIKPVLEDDRVVACGGQVAVSNGIKLVNGEVREYTMPKKIISAMQVLEYERSFLASRIFMNSFNGNMIISGAFGLYKKSTVIAAGGYDIDTLGEDMELVVKLHAFCRANNIDYSIEFAPDAVCWSQTPSNLRDLAIQRRRWHIGLFESLSKYRGVFGKKEYGIVGTISFAYFWLYELMSPYIEIFGIFTIILSFLVGLINVPFMILFFCIYAAFGCVLTLSSFFNRLYIRKMKISTGDVLKAVLLCGFELIGLRFIIMLVRLNALMGYKKHKNNWGEIKRTKQNRFDRDERGTAGE